FVVERARQLVAGTCEKGQRVALPQQNLFAHRFGASTFGDLRPELLVRHVEFDRARLYALVELAICPLQLAAAPADGLIGPDAFGDVERVPEDVRLFAWL